MTKQEAINILGSGLSEPSKMPSYGFGLPATACIVGSRLREVENSTCSKCYAFRGNYTFPHVTNALERRLANLNHPQWVEAVVTLVQIEQAKKRSIKKNTGTENDVKFFRWHDSGDLQSVQHLENISEVARRLPTVKFWLPTREYGIVKDWIEGGGIRPKNLIIRLSGHIINGPYPIALAKKLGVLTSGVHTKDSKVEEGVRECPAHNQNNRCESCRNCWDGRIMKISYPKH